MSSSVQENDSVPKELRNVSACCCLTLQTLKITSEIPQHEIAPELPTSNYSHPTTSYVRGYSHVLPVRKQKDMPTHL